MVHPCSRGHSINTLCRKFFRSIGADTSASVNDSHMLQAHLIIPTVAKIDATSYLTTTVSILLVSVDNSQMHIYNSLKNQRNNRVST